MLRLGTCSVAGGLQLRAAALVRRTVSGHAAVFPRVHPAARQQLHPGRTRLSTLPAVSVAATRLLSAASRAASGTSRGFGGRLIANSRTARVQFRVERFGHRRLHTSARNANSKGGRKQGYWQKMKAKRKRGGGGGGGRNSQAGGRDSNEGAKRVHNRFHTEAQSRADKGSVAKLSQVHNRVLEPNPARDAILAESITVETLGGGFNPEALQLVRSGTRILRSEKIVR